MTYSMTAMTPLKIGLCFREKAKSLFVYCRLLNLLRVSDFSLRSHSSILKLRSVQHLTFSEVFLHQLSYTRFSQLACLSRSTHANSILLVMLRANDKRLLTVVLLSFLLWASRGQNGIQKTPFLVTTIFSILLETKPFVYCCFKRCRDLRMLVCDFLCMRKEDYVYCK